MKRTYLINVADWTGGHVIKEFDNERDARNYASSYARINGVRTFVDSILNC